MRQKRERGRCLSDAKIGKLSRKLRPFLKHVAHMSGRGSKVCPRGKHPENIFAPFGDDLNLSGRQITDPTLEPQFLRLAHGGVTETDALNAAADDHPETSHPGRHRRHPSPSNSRKAFSSRT